MFNKSHINHVFQLYLIVNDHKTFKIFIEESKRKIFYLFSMDESMSISLIKEEKYKKKFMHLNYDKLDIDKLKKLKMGIIKLKPTFNINSYRQIYYMNKVI